MKKNGFVFVETIIAVVVLSSSLLLLYTSFSKILQQEKVRVHYDNISYVYRTWYLKNAFNNLNIMAPLKEVQDSKAFVTIGLSYDELFVGYNREREMMSKLLTDYEVSQAILLKENRLNDLKKCTPSSTNSDCSSMYINLSEEMIRYIKTIFVDVTGTYIIVIEYRSCDSSGKNCSNYYSWVSV